MAQHNTRLATGGTSGVTRSARRAAICTITLGCLLLLVGCAGYHVGAQSLFPQDIRTVYVPMFESNSFRRNLGERLTEAVMKEIELKSTYKVVNSPNADSVLTGRLISDAKQVIVEGPLDDPRQSELTFTVQVTWVDRRSGEVIREGDIVLPPAIADVNQSAKFTPEVGQSVTTAQQTAINRLAEQIVGLMEAPW